MAITLWISICDKGRLKRCSKLLVTFLLFISVHGQAAEMDTVLLGMHEICITEDTVYDGSKTDTILLDKNARYKVKTNREEKNDALFDSISQRTQKIPMLNNLFNAMRVRDKVKVEEDSATTLNPAVAYFVPFEGKVIRKIHYYGVDLFDGRVNDTSKVANSWGTRMLNRAHYNTRTWIIKNYIRFDEGDVVDAELMSDNERVIRSLGFIEDTKIQVLPLDRNSDTVDVLVVTKDNFPIGANVEVFSPNHFLIDPYTNNFIGLGHRLEGRLIYKEAAKTQKFGYGARYKVENLFGAFYSAALGFSKTDQIELYNMDFKKPFITNDIRWGGQLNIYQIQEERYLDRQEEDSLIQGFFDYKATVNNIWAGYTFKYFDQSYSRFLNLGARYQAYTYLNRPEVSEHYNYRFHNSYQALFALSYRKIEYLKTSKLLGFGRTEDVPYGYIFSLTSGYQWTEYYQRQYLGIYSSWAKNYPKVGYFSFGAGAGAYRWTRALQDVVLAAKFGFYSPLVQVGNLEFRNAFSATFMSLTNPVYYNKINFGDDIWLLKQKGLFGDSQFSFRAETIFYSNMNLIGFRFAFYPFVNMGWLANSDYFEGRKRFFSSYGLGIQVKNESLTIPGFHIRVGFLPNLIEGANHFGVSFFFRDLSLSSRIRSLRPEVVNPFLFKD